MRWGLVGIVVIAVGFAAPGGAAAATVSQPLRHISYIAAPGETNDLTIRKTSAGVQVTDPGAIIVAGEGCENVSAHEALCQKKLRQELSIRLDDMSDSAHAIGWFGVPFVDAGDGNDSVTMSRGLDFIKGGPGKDTLVAGRGADYLMGGPGDDILDGGLGVDTADYSERASAVVVDLDGVADDGEPGEADDLRNIENVLGGNGNDILVGNGEANDLLGLGGDDRIRGGAGPDKVTGGQGSDILRGNSGADWLRGLEAMDLLNGGKGSDRMEGGSGNDRIEARDGVRDSLTGGRGTDRARVDWALDRWSSIQLFL